MKDSSPLISVIVMTFNRPAALARCLRSLVVQSIGRAAFEVVIVDVSTPPVGELVATFRNALTIKYLKEVNKGVAGNRNVGACNASGPWLAYLDDDCVADRSWLEELAHMTEQFPDSLIGGAITNLLPDNPVAIAGQLITDAVDRHFNPDPLDARFVPGLNFAVPRRLYLELGGSDETYQRLAAEDRDFCVRWRARGIVLSRQSRRVLLTSIEGMRRDFCGSITITGAVRGNITPIAGTPNRPRTAISIC